jgi:hypothetical protein
VWCDNTEELLVAMLRTGKAGSNTAADHITVLADAIGQVPAAHRKRLLVRSDGAGASHDLLDWLTETRPRNVWTPATDADGGIPEGGDIAEVTGLLDLKRWPDRMRVIVRRERPHPGAQLSLFEEREGWRYQAFVTNTSTLWVRRAGTWRNR